MYIDNVYCHQASTRVITPLLSANPGFFFFFCLGQLEETQIISWLFSVYFLLSSRESKIFPNLMCYPWSENQPKDSVNSVVWNGTLVGGSGQHLAGRGMSSHRFGV